MEPVYVVGIGVAVLLALRKDSNTTATDGPSQTAVGDIARAIAHAEGFGVDANNKPTRQHNPGDIRSSGGPIATYPDDAAGWAALEHQVSKILDGTSKYYRPDMPLIQVANIYTDADHAINWAETVAGDLGITINDPLTSYTG